MQIIAIAGLACLWVKRIQRAGGDSTGPLHVWGQKKQACGLGQLPALKGFEESPPLWAIKHN